MRHYTFFKNISKCIICAPHKPPQDIIENSKRNINTIYERINSNGIDQSYVDDLEKEVMVLKSLRQADLESRKDVTGYLIQEIQKIKKEYQVQFKKNNLEILFPDVKIYHNGEDIELGSYKVLFHNKYLHSKSCIDIEYSGVTRRNCIHPHIAYGDCEDINICWGDFEDEIDRGLRNGRLYNVVQLIESFLYSYNESDSYVNIMLWSKKEKCGVCKKSMIDCRCEECPRCNHYEDDCDCYCDNCENGLSYCTCDED